MRDKVRESIENSLSSNRTKSLNDITEFLIDNTKFDLPDTFEKMVANLCEKPPSAEEAMPNTSGLKKGSAIS